MLTTSDQVLLLALWLMPGTASRAERDADDECPSKYDGYCLNGGVCQYLRDQDEVLCLCPTNWWGPRCHHALVDLPVEQTEGPEEEVQLAVIIGAIFVSLLLLFFIILFILCLRRYRRRRERRHERQRQQLQLNGVHAVAIGTQLSEKTTSPLMVEYMTTV